MVPKLDPTTFKENQIFEDIHQAVKKSNEFTVSTNDGLVIRFSSLQRRNPWHLVMTVESVQCVELISHGFVHGVHFGATSN